MNLSWFWGAKVSFKTLWQWLRLPVGLLLITWVLLVVNWQDLRTAWFSINWWEVGLAFAVVIVWLFLCVFRWSTLLIKQNVHLSFWILLRYYLHGQFFLIVTPSFIGADFVRTLDIRQRTQQTASGFAAVLIERLSGLLAVALWGSGAAWFSYKADNRLLLCWLTTSIAILLGIIWLAVLQPRLLGFSLRLIPFQRGRNFLSNFQTAAHIYQKQPLTMIWTLCLSMLAQFLVIVANYTIIHAVGYRVPFFQLIPIVALSGFISAIPVSPNALGLQEASYVVLMAPLGIVSSDALLISLLVRSLNLGIALVGGIDYFLIRSKE